MKLNLTPTLHVPGEVGVNLPGDDLSWNLVRVVQRGLKESTKYGSVLSEEQIKKEGPIVHDDIEEEPIESLEERQRSTSHAICSRPSWYGLVK